MADKDLDISWLNDAYGMETSLVTALENHIKDAEGFPDLQLGLRQHLEQTRNHANLIKGCVERMGGDTSALKAGLSNVGTAAKNLLNRTAKDTVVKNTLDDFTSEHLEIASYTSLIAAAEAIGDMETASICRNILMDEEQAANLVRGQIPLVTTETLRGKVGAKS
jgi:ferritin-like metal-binding protein YciE